VSHDIQDSRARACGHVESPACHHCCHCREAAGQRGRPQLRGRPVVDLRAAGPLPGRRGGGVRAAVAAAEDLASRDQRRHCRADRRAAQGTVRAGAWTPARTPSAGTCATITRSPSRRRPSAGTSPARAWSPPSRPGGRSPPASGLPPTCPTSAGSPTSPTTGSPGPTAAPARTRRSWAGWMTTPGWCYP
jgi:hypothetical protein